MSRRSRTGAPDPRFFKPPRGSAGKPGRGSAARLPQPLTATAQVRDLTDEGRGVAVIDGETRPLFVAGGLPGDTVSLRVRRWHKRFGEADLLGIESPSPRRIAAECVHFGRCGGCQLQMLAPADQFAHKQAVLGRLLAPFQPFAWQPPLTDSPWHYRHRLRLAVERGADGEPVVGFRASQSHQVVAVPECRVVDRRLQPLLALLPGWLRQLRDWQRIRELRLAVDADGQLALGWKAEPALGGADRARLAAAAALAKVTVAQASALPAAEEPGAPGPELVYEVLPAEDLARPLRYRFAIDDFTQVNPAVNQLLVQQVCSWLVPAAGEQVVDAFCGLGNFSLALAQQGARVTGIEVDAAMVQRATANAEQAGLSDRLSFRAGDLFIEPALPRADKLLLDPPRAGARALCESLAAASTGSRFQRIVYVSCNPHTLARDLGLLVGGGYRIDQAVLVDMFPHTGHIESAVLLIGNGASGAGTASTSAA